MEKDGDVMKKSKQARAREFSQKTRQRILSRDGDRCIFCVMGYHMEKADWYAKSLLSIMHYVPRARGGLGIEQNGAVGCEYHHHMMDNGHEGRRAEMLERFREYLKGIYPNWDEKALQYHR